MTNEASSGDASVVANAEREARAPRAAGIAGLVFAALFVFSVTLLGNHPAPGSSAAEIASWYTRESRTIALVGLYLVPFAGIAFLWFVAVIRDVVGDREDRFLATVSLGGGLLFVALLFAAAASAGALIALIRFQGAPAPSPDSVDLARSLAYAFMYVFGVRVAAVFVLVSSTIGRRTGMMPRSLAFAGVAVGAGAPLHRLVLSVHRAPLPFLGEHGQHRDPDRQSGRGPTEIHRRRNGLSTRPVATETGRAASWSDHPPGPIDPSSGGPAESGNESPHARGRQALMILATAVTRNSWPSSASTTAKLWPGLPAGTRLP